MSMINTKVHMFEK